MPKISIIIPIYNGSAYLHQCIDSLIQQTFTDWEALLIDDGSTDESPSICQSYAEKDSRIHYISQKNQGVCAARNKGMDLASGDWILFSDQDDWFTPDACQVLLDASKGKSHVIGGVAIEREGKIYGEEQGEGESFPISSQELRLANLWPQGYSFPFPSHFPLVCIWGRLYQREILKKHNIEFPVGIQPLEDNLFNLEALSVLPDVVYVDKPLYVHRIIPTSAGQSRKPRLLDNTIKALETLKPLEKGTPDEQEALLYFQQAAFLAGLRNLYENEGRSTIKALKKLKTYLNHPSFQWLTSHKLPKAQRAKRVIHFFIRKKMALPVFVLASLWYSPWMEKRVAQQKKDLLERPFQTSS